MKRSRGSTGILVIVLVLVSLQLTVVSTSNLAERDNEGTGVAVTIQQIIQHIQEEGVRMSKKKINLAAQTIFEESLRHGVDYRLILAIMKVESNFRQYGISPDGARGFMQVRPILAVDMAEEAGINYRGLEDLYDVKKNIRLGTYYISKLMNLFDDMPEVLFAYNVGHNKAKELLAADGTPHTTYTRRVIAEYKKNTKKMNGVIFM
ncbi:MAG: lytic transglycosylase domain-containing protein [Smithella sp.]